MCAVLSNPLLFLFTFLLLQVELGYNPQLEEYFGCPGPFWGRQYYFWHGGAPLTLIYEVFSNKLAEYLGPPNQCFTVPGGTKSTC